MTPVLLFVFSATLLWTSRGLFEDNNTNNTLSNYNNSYNNTNNTLISYNDTNNTLTLNSDIHIHNRTGQEFKDVIVSIETGQPNILGPKHSPPTLKHRRLSMAAHEGPGRVQKSDEFYRIVLNNPIDIVTGKNTIRFINNNILTVQKIYRFETKSYTSRHSKKQHLELFLDIQNTSKDPIPRGPIQLMESLDFLKLYEHQNPRGRSNSPDSPELRDQ